MPFIMKKYFLVCCLIFTLLSCNDAQQQRPIKEADLPAKTPGILNGTTILDQDQRLSRADSLVFVFYKDPHGADSLRYTRYYTQRGVTDTAVLGFFKAQLNDSTERVEKVRHCRSEGKVWCFERGDIFQTVYFSTSAAPCSFIYIIKDGQFYYSKMTPTLSKKLSDIKRTARGI